MKLHYRVAATRGDILRCQNLIAEVYCHHYGVVFSEDIYDLDAKIEPWPHRYLMTLADGELIATCGLYTHNTYVERFGQVDAERIRAAVEDAQPGDWGNREICKLVVHPNWRRRGLASLLWAVALSRSFFELDARRPPTLLFCGKRSIVRNIMERHTKVRQLKEFPLYKVHENYRSETDPMHSYLTIPDVDVPRRFRGLSIPGNYTYDELAKGIQ